MLYNVVPRYDEHKQTQRLISKQSNYKTISQTLSTAFHKCINIKKSGWITVLHDCIVAISAININQRCELSLGVKAINLLCPPVLLKTPTYVFASRPIYFLLLPKGLINYRRHIYRAGALVSC